MFFADLNLTNVTVHQTNYEVCQHFTLCVDVHHRKNSPLIRIDGDTVQVQRTEYGQCQTDVDVHGVRLAVREHAY